MTNKEFLTKMILTNKGIVTTAEALREGISKQYFFEYVKNCGLEKVGKGIYATKDAWLDHLYLLQLQYPNIVSSHETALFLHNLNDSEPMNYTVTVASGYNANRLIDKGVKVVRVKKEWFAVGLTELPTPGGHIVKSYNLERTICDIIRSRNKIEIQDLTDSLKTYAKRKDKNIPELMRYAKQLRVEKVLRQYLEVLL